MRTAAEEHGKMNRHRERLRAAGLRQIQFWVLDTRLPEIPIEVRRQCALLKKNGSETEIISFCEDAAGEIKGWE